MKQYRLICENAIEENDIIYFPGFHGSGLYAYDKNKQDTTRLGVFPDKVTKGLRLYEAIIKHGSKLFIAPSNANPNLAVFDLDNGEFKMIDLEIDDSGMFKFDSIIPYENYVYLIGQSAHVILKVNLNTYKFEIVYENHNIEKFMCINGAVIENLAYIPFLLKSEYLVLNLETSEIKAIKYKSSINSSCGIVPGINNDLWIIGLYEPYLINTDYDGNVISEVEISSLKGISTPYGLFENPVKEGNLIYIFPLGARAIYCYNISTGIIEECEAFEDILKGAYNEVTKARLLSFQTREHFVYLIEGNTKMWHEVNLTDRTYTSFEVRQDRNVIYKYWKRGIVENEKIDLKNLIDVIK